MTTPRKSLEPFLKDAVQYYPHQITGVRRMAGMDSFLLADDMGLGKSLQALTVFCIDVKLGKAETLLVVCPVTLRDNWADEVTKFTRLPCTLLGEVPHPTRRGETKKVSPKVREQQLQDFLSGVGPRILICNYEQLVNKAHAQSLRTHRFDCLVLDEAHKIKNQAAQRTKAALGIRARRSFVLTGTPMLNQVNELWALLHRIDPMKYPKYWTFVNRYCVFGGYENRQVIGVKNELELKKILGSLMIRRMKDDVLDRTKPTYIKHKVGMSDEQRKLYDQIVEELFYVDSSGQTKDVENALTKMLRCKQICDTPYAIDPMYPDDSLKLDRVVELVSEIVDRGDKVVIFTQFRSVIEVMVTRLYNEKIKQVYQLHGGVPQKDRQPTVNEWGSNPKGAVIICMIQVAGVGLNMVQASEIIFIDKDVVPGINKQAVDRCDRIGQTHPVIVHEMYVRGSIEARVEEILGHKDKLNEVIVGGGVNMGKLVQMLKEQMENDM